VIKIYIDVYFLINFCLDYLSLFTSCTVLHRSVSSIRLVAAALIGALSSTLALLLSAPAITLFLLPVTLFLMCKTVFGRRLFSGALLFLSFGIFFGGLLTALEGITKKRFSSPLVLLPIILLSICAVGVFFTVQKRVRVSLETLSVTARVSFGGEEVELSLLVDSGNLVREPVTGLRVIFIGRAASLRLIPPEGTESFEVNIRSAAGTSTKMAYLPKTIKFDKGYEGEHFLILPNTSHSDFAGYDGIVPLPEAIRREKCFLK